MNRILIHRAGSLLTPAICSALLARFLRRRRRRDVRVARVAPVRRGPGPVTIRRRARDFPVGIADDVHRDRSDDREVRAGRALAPLDLERVLVRRVVLPGERNLSLGSQLRQRLRRRTGQEHSRLQTRGP